MPQEITRIPINYSDFSKECQSGCSRQGKCVEVKVTHVPTGREWTSSIPDHTGPDEFAITKTTKFTMQSLHKQLLLEFPPPLKENQATQEVELLFKHFATYVHPSEAVALTRLVFERIDKNSQGGHSEEN